jgi:membrane-associated protease RseP (regulator of RpoE activity)
MNSGSKMMSISGSLFMLLILGGCAAPVTQRVNVDPYAKSQEEHKQKIAAIKSEVAMVTRINTVGYAVLKGAVSDCGKIIRQRVGIGAPLPQDFPEKTRALVSEALGLDGTRRVVYVAKGSAAETAGLRVGDVFSDSGGILFASVADESREASFARLPSGQKITATVTRGGVATELFFLPDTVCDYPLEFSASSEVNAFADGKKIFITKGMARFASDDRELAMVIGHELGHNTMGHREKKTINAGIGLLFDIAAAAAGVNTQSAFSKAGAQSFSQDFESEADYVGLYYLARSGYDTSGAAEFWRRMALENPASISSNHSASHPATSERFLALEQVSAEIGKKATAGDALVPNRK